MSEILSIASFLQNEASYPVVLATLVSVEGSSYRRAGARRVICPDGAALGAISGGCLEEDLREHAIALLNSSAQHELIVYDTTSENDLVWGVGTGCHGVVKIYLEKLSEGPTWTQEILTAAQERRTSNLATPWQHPAADRGENTTAICDGENTHAKTFLQIIPPPRRVIIFGGGDDAQPLCQQSATLGWNVIVCDPRPGVALPSRFPEAQEVLELHQEDAGTRFQWDDHTAAVVMTHHYRFDLPLLRSLVPLRLAFLGLLGPKARGERLLRDAGFDPTTTDLHNPIGLDLGGDGPESIALSIIAEIQAHFNQRSGRPLRERRRPIHDNESDE